MNIASPKANTQAGLNAALDNLDPEWQATLARNGVDILLIAFDGRPGSKVWTRNAAWIRIGRELQHAGCGTYTNSLPQGEFYFSFYQIMNLARGLTLAKAELQRLELLDCAQMLVCEPGQKWQQYWPATAAEVSTT
jgi:hypothetical protein